MLNIVTQLDQASTTRLQGIYKQLPFRYFVDLLSLLESFGSWYLLVYLTRSKPTVNKMLDNNNILLQHFVMIPVSAVIFFLFI